MPEQPTVHIDEPDLRNPLEIVANAMLEMLDNEGTDDVQAIVLLVDPTIKDATATIATRGYEGPAEVLVDMLHHAQAMGRVAGVSLIPIQVGGGDDHA